MKKLVFFLLIGLLMLTFCHKDHETPSPSDVWDLDKNGIPKFVSINYIDISRIYRISRFRSSVGHDYSDAFEQCRSLKHYFQPFDTADWTTVRIVAPVKGKITHVEQEWAGTKIEIVSDLYPAFRFQIFHVNPVNPLNVGNKVDEGQFLGSHVGTQTMSDISVIVNEITHQGKMVSYFEVLTASAAQQFLLRGVNDLQDFIIPRELRDQYPLTCIGDQFSFTDVLENWVILH